jgi:hypothetical protein
MSDVVKKNRSPGIIPRVIVIFPCFCSWYCRGEVTLGLILLHKKVYRESLALK